MYGLSDDEIATIREGKLDGFTRQEVSLLRMSDSCGNSFERQRDELYTELRTHFSEEQLMELAANAALENYRARFNRMFNAGSDGLYRKGVHFKPHRAA